MGETIAGDFATEALLSCGIANAANELVALSDLGASRPTDVKDRFFDIVCNPETMPLAETDACAVNLANMGRAFHACACKPEPADIARHHDAACCRHTVCRLNTLHCIALHS